MHSKVVAYAMPMNITIGTVYKQKSMGSDIEFLFCLKRKITENFSSASAQSFGASCFWRFMDLLKQF